MLLALLLSVFFSNSMQKHIGWSADSLQATCQQSITVELFLILKMPMHGVQFFMNLIQWRKKPIWIYLPDILPVKWNVNQTLQLVVIKNPEIVNLGILQYIGIQFFYLLSSVCWGLHGVLTLHYFYSFYSCRRYVIYKDISTVGVLFYYPFCFVMACLYYI